MGQTRWIDLRDGHDKCSYSCAVEVFRLFLQYTRNTVFWYEIYDVNSGDWTTLDVIPRWRIYCSSPSVSLKEIVIGVLIKGAPKVARIT